MTDAREALAYAAKRRLATMHISDFGELLVPGYKRARHTDLLCEKLEAVAAGEISRLIVEMPPGCGKSTTVSRMFPAYFLGHNPTKNIIIGSHSAELAEGHSRAARGMVANPDYPFDGVDVSAHSAAVNRWQTTHGGGVIAVGVGGGVTGWRADIVVCDDPIADREQADSPAYRDRVWRWWSEAMLTRLNRGAGVVLLHTRWNPDDVIGRVLNSAGAEQWVRLTLPMIAEDDDALGRAPGEPLWPEEFDAEACNAKRLDVGERGWAALFQARPTPQAGNLFQRDWLAGRYTRLPETELRIVTAVDASFGQGVHSDYSAIVTVASDGSSYYVLDVVRGRWHFAELLAQIRRVNETHNPTAIVVEDVGAGRSALQELRRASDLPIVGVKPDGSKIVRAESILALFEGGRVLFPEQAPRWRDELVEELAGFPSVKHDDCTDSLVYALRRLREREGREGGGVVGVLYYDALGRLILDDDEPAPSYDELSAHEVFVRTGFRDPLSGGIDEFEDDGGD